MSNTTLTTATITGALTFTVEIGQTVWIAQRPRGEARRELTVTRFTKTRVICTNKWGEEESFSLKTGVEIGGAKGSEKRLYNTATWLN